METRIDELEKRFQEQINALGSTLEEMHRALKENERRQKDLEAFALKLSKKKK
jgi:uncharacterized coiled-coil protein SlyX